MSGGRRLRHRLREIVTVDRLAMAGTAVVAALGLWIAWDAKQATVESNRLQQQSNDLAAQAQSESLSLEVIRGRTEEMTFNMAREGGWSLCAYPIRFLNLGGADATLVDFNAAIGYRGGTWVGDPSAFPKLSFNPVGAGDLNSFRFWVLATLDSPSTGDRDERETALDQELSDWPLVIEASSFADVWLVASYAFDATLHHPVLVEDDTDPDPRFEKVAKKAAYRSGRGSALEVEELACSWLGPWE